MPETGGCTINFDKLHSVIEGVNLHDCQGAVVRVSGLKVESAGPVVGLGEMCGIHIRDGRRVLAEVVGFHNENLILLPLEYIEGISPGDAVTARTTPRYINLSGNVLGRVLNGLGEPIDGKGGLEGSDKRALDSASPPPLSRGKITEPLALGIRSIDGLLTCGKGQRVGIFSGSGVGKSVLLGDIANSSEADVNIVALIGERGRVFGGGPWCGGFVPQCCGSGDIGFASYTEGKGGFCGGYGCGVFQGQGEQCIVYDGFTDTFCAGTA